MSFIIIAAALLLFVVGIIAIPLLRQQRTKILQTTDANRAVYTSRIEELKNDVETGALAREDYDAALKDLEADFQSSVVTPVYRNRSKRGWIAIAVVVVGAPVIAAVLYLQWGNWQSALYGAQSVPAVTANLKQRLNESPNDPDGWAFLSRVYASSEQYKKAAEADKHAVALTHGKQAAPLAALGSNEMLANQMRATPQIAALFDNVLKLDPNNTRGLLFGGMAAMQQGDRDTALRRWKHLLTLNPSAPLRRILTARIETAGGVVPSTVASSQAINIDVSVSDAVAAQIPKQATLFVFVRPANSHKGPPLAVRRLVVSQFPVQVKLSDADAMVPGQHIEDYDNLRVVARISQSGAPMAHQGDVYGSANFAWKGKGAPLDIVLNRVVTD